VIDSPIRLVRTSTSADPRQVDCGRDGVSTVTDDRRPGPSAPFRAPKLSLRARCVIDFLLGLYLAGLAVRGWLRGFVKELLDLVGLIVGLVVAFRVSAPSVTSSPTAST
jgi:hypothetical protein